MTTIAVTLTGIDFHSDVEGEDVYLDVDRQADPDNIELALGEVYRRGFVPLIDEGEPLQDTPTGWRLHCRFGDEMLDRLAARR